MRGTFDRGIALWVVAAVFPAFSAQENPKQHLLEVYATARQVSRYCSTGDDRRKVAEALGELGIRKIYLESYRSGYRPPTGTLLDARDDFRRMGFLVATGITTTPGEGVIRGSNRNRLFGNYELEETREGLKGLFRFMATHFDEIMIDDFFLTDDDSPISQAAKGDRSWSEYRLELMSAVARQAILEPARNTNPDVVVTLKFPQWYDRFHQYGYNPPAAAHLFDRLWVGTETRNPETPRFGYVQPTEGFINYSWLASLGRGKVRGAWFDPLDGTPDVYLMQAFQSLLAGAPHLTLFNLGEILEENPVLRRFRKKIDSLEPLADLVAARRNRGLLLYKPPNLDFQEDYYAFDYLAVLGIPVRPVGFLPEKPPRGAILTAHAAADPGILPVVEKWLASKTSVMVTPGFLRAVRGTGLAGQVGFSSDLPQEPSLFRTRRLTVHGNEILADTDLEFETFPMPEDAEILASAWSGSGVIPVLTRKQTVSGGTLLFLNLSTYNRREYSDGGEMFLSPRRLTLPDWPADLADAVRTEISGGLPVRVLGQPPFSVTLLGEDLIVLASFQNAPLEVSVRLGEKTELELEISPDFPHQPQARLDPVRPGVYRAVVPPWDLLVVRVR